MRLSVALVEAARSAGAQRVASVLIALLCAVICAVTMLTVGGTAAAEAQVLGRLDAAGSRLLIVTDKRGAGLVNNAALDMLHGLNTVERAVGVDTPFDVTNVAIGDGGTPTPAWSLVGPLREAMTLTAGRWPQPGEALVSNAAHDTLGLTNVVGAVIDREGREYPVVGGFKALTPFEFLDAGAVIAHDRDSASVTSLHVVVVSAAAARATEQLVISVLGPADLAGLTVQSPTALADLHRAVSGDLGGYSRGLLLVTLGTGAVLIAIVVLAEVLLRRRDLGRRRAVGASRSALIMVVVFRATIASAPGVLLGLAIGSVVASNWGQLPPLTFTVGTGTLTLISAAMSAVPPALLAAWRDPVTVLRTP
jgi:putative ABC transport system permease protein